MWGAFLTTVFFVALTALTGDMVWDDFRYDETSSGLGVPRWWYTVWVPVLSLAIAFRARQVWRRLKAAPEWDLVVCDGAREPDVRSAFER